MKRKYKIRHTRKITPARRIVLACWHAYHKLTYRRLLVWRGILVRCGVPCCEGFQGPCCKVGERRAMNTAYVVHEQNFCHMCEDCFEGVQAYWAERWAEHRSSVL